MSNAKQRTLVPEGGINGRYPDDLPRREPPEIPDYTMNALVDYVENGTPRGSFITAMLSGQLYDACVMADSENRWVLPEIARWLHCVPPGQCYGSTQKMKAWIKMNPMERTRLVNGCPTWEDFLAARVVVPAENAVVR